MQDIINDFSRFVTTNNRCIISRVCIVMVVLMSSFDVFLTFDIAGYTFRVAQIFLGIAIVIYIISILSNRCWKISKFLMPLITWIVLQFILIYNSPNVNNAVGYFLWLLMDMFIILIMYQEINEESIIDFYKIYLDSFYLLSWLGIIQFVLGLLGVNFYIYSWFGKIPRIRGFSFESSYYGTYLIIGWIILSYLVEKGTILYKRKKTITMWIAVTVALVLSTSRMSILFMGIWIAFRIVINAFFNIKNKKLKYIARILLVALVCITGVVTYLIIKTTVLDVYLQGLGIKGLSSHSADDRLNGVKRLFDIFIMSPLKGYSIGGVDPIISEVYNVKFHTGLGFCVWMELLVASGIIGFLILIIGIVFPIYELMKKNKKTIYANEAGAIVWAFIMEAGILSFNQNILRIYFWVLFGMIFVFIKHRRLQ